MKSLTPGTTARGVGFQRSGVQFQGSEIRGQKPTMHEAVFDCGMRIAEFGNSLNSLKSLKPLKSTGERWEIRAQK